MNDVIAILEEWMGKLEQRFARTDLRSLKSRLESLNKDPRYRFMFGKFGSEDNMSSIIGKIFRIPLEGAPVTIMQMAGLPNEVVNSVVSVLARLAFDVAVWSGSNFEVAVVCEEAHRYIPNNSTLGFAPTRQAIGRIAKEGRKYGASLGVITQRPSELDSTVLSQCSTMFAMRLPNESDKAIIRAALSESSASTISFLSSLANRECIAFGEAIPSPMRMKFGYIEWRADPASAHAAPATNKEIDRFDLRRIIGKMRGESAVEAV
jgi:DNA helicase HerA-like ATPase